MEKQTVYHFFASSILFIYEGYEVVTVTSTAVDVAAFPASSVCWGSRREWGVVTVGLADCRRLERALLRREQRTRWWTTGCEWTFE
jgi:flavin reductase (DIM6/NTAB) family NADH-FMN oxidoreductase RutF